MTTAAQIATLQAERAQRQARHQSTVIVDRKLRELRHKQLARETNRVRVKAITRESE